MPIKFLQRSLLPIAVFAAVMGLHYVWTGRSLEGACIDETLPNGQTVCHELSGWSAYVESKSYWLGYSYGLSLAFAGVALRRYREQRLCADRNLAIGGVTLSGFLAVAGCFLVGCCGSPMLGVYLSLFSASFLPWAKPLVAGLTTVMIAASYWWMRNRSGKEKSCEPCL